MLLQPIFLYINYYDILYNKMDGVYAIFRASTWHLPTEILLFFKGKAFMAYFIDHESQSSAITCRI
jgi:hypothetical protein